MRLQLTDSNPEYPTINVGRGTTVDGWRDELTEYYATMKNFEGMSPDAIFMSLSAFTARASEIRSILVQEDTRLFRSFRINEIDPFINECDRQFKFWSRIVTIQQVEIELAGRVM